MFTKVRFVFLYWLIWILIFEFSRLLFLFYNFSDAQAFASGSLLKTFLYGLRMDASMASYLLLPLCILLILSDFFKVFANPALYRIYTGIILLPVLIIIFCDLPVYRAWGNRLDATPLKYLASPKEAWASVSHLPVFWIVLGFLICYILLFRLFRRFINSHIVALKNKSNKYGKLLLIVFTALQVIPLRGGIQMSPLNQSTVYFSRDNFINLSAINVTWNFMYSLSKNTASTVNPFAYFDDKQARAIKDSLFFSQGKREQVTDLVKNPAPNIILIIWESGIEKASRLIRDGHPVMPGLNELKKEGIYFSDIYCSGDRTDKGIAAVLSGYPAQPITSIIKIPKKAATLPTLPTLYKNKNYNTSFYYGGELEFANMKSYLLGCGFQNFTSKDDFESKDQNSKWGAHDHIVKNRILSDLSTTKSPFFTTWLTLSSHEPFETPVNTVIRGADGESQYMNSLHYTDSILYDFVQQSKKQSWWDNTIIVITADHGHRLPQTGKQIDDFKIPFLIVGGALTNKGIEINRTGSQTDIAATLLGQTGIQQNPFIWSKDLFNDGTKSWAYFSIYNAFGFVQQDRYYIFDNIGRIIMEKKGNITEEDTKKGKAIEQETFADYLSR